MFAGYGPGLTVQRNPCDTMTLRCDEMTCVHGMDGECAGRLDARGQEER